MVKAMAASALGTTMMIKVGPIALIEVVVATEVAMPVIEVIEVVVAVALVEVVIEAKVVVAPTLGA
jgi:hypothetical protein